MAEPAKALEDGTLDPRWIGSLTGEELAQWVFDVLHSRELDVPGAPDAPAYGLLVDAYHAADAEAKRALARAIANRVRDMADNPRSDWRGAPGDQLLLAASEVCGADIAPAVRRMVAARQFADPEAGVPGDIHFRLLQTLVALGVQETRDFWEEHARISPQHYVGIAFRGAAGSSLSDAIELLARVPVKWTPDLTASIERAVEGLSDRHGSEAIGRIISDAWPHLPAGVREVLSSYRRREAATAPTPVGTSPTGPLSRQDGLPPAPVGEATSAEPALGRASHRMFCRLKRVELSIIGVLWDAGEGRTVREVFEELYSSGPWSYNTVRTTMARMVKANVLKQGRRGHSNVYVPTVGKEEAAAACVQEIITAILGGKLADGAAAVLKRLPLSPAEVRTAEWPP